MSSPSGLSALRGFIVDTVKGLLARSPARFIAYGSAAAITIAAWAFGLVGITALPDPVTNAFGIIGTFVVTELIRRFVYSPNTVVELLSTAPPDAQPGDTE